MPLGLELALWAAAHLILLAAYSWVYNPYWTIGGDADFYFALGRNLYQGEGLWHNGNPVGTTPPGWPMLLSWAMHLTPRVGFLRLINTFALLAFFATTWWGLRRCVGPAITAAATLMVGLSHDVVEMNWRLLSDPVFAMMAGLAIVAALGVNLSPGRTWNRWLLVPATVAITALSVTVRWPGILLLPIIAAALYDRRIPWHFRLDRRLVCAVLTVAFTFGVFFWLRAILPADPAQVDERFPTTMTGNYALINDSGAPQLDEYWDRLGWGGYYYSRMLWQPFSGAKLFVYGLGRFGWVMVGLALLATIAAAARRRWLLLGAIGFCLPIVFTWPSAIPRYLLPAFPFIIAGSLQGILEVGALVGAAIASCKEQLSYRAVLASRQAAVSTAFAGGVASMFVGVTLLIQWGALNMSATVMDRGVKVDEYVDAGSHRRLPVAAAIVDAADPAPGEVAVSERKQVQGRSGRTHGWMRAVHLLLDRPVRTVPYELSHSPESSPGTMQWLQDHGVRFYFYQPGVNSVLDFPGGRLEQWVWRRRDPVPASEAAKRSQDWRLYEIGEEFEGGFRRIRLGKGDPPRYVPHQRDPSRLPPEQLRFR